jgi:integrase
MKPGNVIALNAPVHAGKQVWTDKQQRLLDMLKLEENRHLPVKTLCQKAGVSIDVWYGAIKNPQYVAIVETLGGRVKRLGESHLDVHLAVAPEEELAKDIWDMRRLKSDYPKHKPPSGFKINFSWIVNPVLRQQVKDYFRLHLPRWKARTFYIVLSYMRHFLHHLSPEIHLGLLNRSQIEELLPKVYQSSPDISRKSLQKMKTMLDYMAASPAWSGPRPPRSLIWAEDIPPLPETFPRPIPPNVLDQFDVFLAKAVEAMKQGQAPFLLSSMCWDALLILRHTGMRFEDLAHLKAPDETGRNGCLEQDTEGYWWIRIHHKITKMGRDHRIPTRKDEGVIDAVHRQRERIKEIPDHFGEQYLFRTTRGVLTYENMRGPLEKLAQHLKHEEQPYLITPHQFRHTIATSMIEEGMDIYMVKEFLGHKSLAMTEKYVAVYLKSLKAKYDAYRMKKQQTSASETMGQVQITHLNGEADGGWVPEKVGKLYLSPLPDGIGKCAHLPMHDPCPDVPHCPTCPKLRATKRHLPVWENKIKNLRLTVEVLQANPAYARAREKHEQELYHAEKVVETIRREGFWDGRIHNNEAIKS